MDGLASEQVSVYATALLVAPGPAMSQGACVLASVTVRAAGRSDNKVKLYYISYTWTDEDPRG